MTKPWYSEAEFREQVYRDGKAMEPPRFAEPRIKLSRSLKFIRELEIELEKYNKNAVYDLAMVMVDGVPKISWKWNCFSLEAGAVLGDVVHNMRASLDLMASELARINNESDKGVYFPFSESKESLPEQIKSKKFFRAGSDAVDLLETFAPYKNGNIMLRAIHDMDVGDKHRAILETEKKFNVSFDVRYDIEDPMSAEVDFTSILIEHEFASYSPLAGYPLIETLKELVQLVERILKSFDDLVISRG